MKKQGKPKSGHHIVPRSPEHPKPKTSRRPLSLVRKARVQTLMGGLIQADIATMLRISPSHVSLIMNGKRLPSVDVASHLAKVLHVTVDDLLETLTGK